MSKLMATLFPIGKEKPKRTIDKNTTLNPGESPLCVRLPMRLFRTVKEITVEKLVIGFYNLLPLQKT